MLGYVKNHQADKAIDLFNQIKNPDEVIIILFLNACAKTETEKTLNLIKKTLLKIPKSFLSNNYLFTSLIDALAKCGDIKYAESLFDQSKNKSLEMYASMMRGKLNIY